MGDNGGGRGQKSQKMGDFIYKLPLMKLPTTSYSILIIHHYLTKKQYTNEYKKKSNYSPFSCWQSFGSNLQINGEVPSGGR